MANVDNWSSARLKEVPVGNDGWVTEDVMREIWDISNIPLPLTDLCGDDTCEQEFSEWNEDRLSDPDTANAYIDGQDIDQNDAKGGERLGNHCQVSVKGVTVSARAQASDTIGGNQLSYQISERQKENMRDVEAIMLTNQGSQEDDGDAVPGLSAGLGAMITQGDLGASTGGGYNTTTKLWTARTPGAKRALTETMVKTVAQQVWTAGGDPTILMSLPSIIAGLSDYMFTASARISTLQQDNTAGQSVTASGDVNAFLTNHGVVLRFIPNRIQQAFQDVAASGTPDTGNVYILDPSYIRRGILRGNRVEPLAKLGLSDRRMMSMDWSLKVLNRDAHGIIADIDPAAPVVAA